jgi:hypothetical protein
MYAMVKANSLPGAGEGRILPIGDFCYRFANTNCAEVTKRNCRDDFLTLETVLTKYV